jgi:RNA polymerase sigma-70 factor (ECF subfamily)
MINGSGATLVIRAAGGKGQSAPAVWRRTYGYPVVRQEFDAEYIERLTDGDRAVEEHFTSYFEGLLRVKLRRRGCSGPDIEDVCQETFLRVLQMLRKKGIEHPERIGAFVNSVCNNVMLELWRSHARHPGVDSPEHETPDTALDMEGILMNEERKRFVHVVLKEMPELEAGILRMIFVDDMDRDEICKQLNLRRDYLRVILHRALTRFKKLADGTGTAVSA